MTSFTGERGSATGPLLWATDLRLTHSGTGEPLHFHTEAALELRTLLSAFSDPDTAGKPQRDASFIGAS